MQEGFDKTLEHMTWKDSFSMSQEIVEDAKLMDLRKRPAQFIAGYYRTREKFGAALYGAAITGKTSVSFHGRTFDAKGADGKALFDKAHPSALERNKGTQSNQFADAFSNDALGAMETAMQDFRGDNGEILDVAPDTILIPNNYKLKKDVFAAIGADKDPTTSNNGFNYQYGRWSVIIWPYLNQFITADTSPWVLLDSRYNEQYGGAMWFDRVQLNVRSEIDPGNDANVWKGRAPVHRGLQRLALRRGGRRKRRHSAYQRLTAQRPGGGFAAARFSDRRDSMTVAQVIQAVDAVKPNAFSNEEKTRWLNEVEGMVQTEVLLFASEEVITYSYEQDKDAQLLVQPPHDKLYPAYLEARVDYANGDMKSTRTRCRCSTPFSASLSGGSP